MINRAWRFGLTVGVGLWAVAASAADYVWWEGERPSASSFPKQHAFAPAGDAQAAVLSEGAWIGVDGDYGETRHFLEYKVETPQEANYKFFARKFWKHGPFRWQFDGGAWHELTQDATVLLESTPMREFVTVSWVPLGDVTLAKGAHTLRIELTAKGGAACFDAFLLVSEPFTPRGKMKPDDAYPPAAAGWFNVDPPHDRFQASPIDLRRLNEPVAGSKGFIRCKGEDFVYERTGEKVRFWAVNAGGGVADMPHDVVDQLARFLAKYGVNQVRLHGGMYVGQGPNAGDIDAKHLDNVFYFVAAMKKQGIYTHLSIHFQHWLNLSQRPGWEEYQKIADGRPFAIHFFNEAYQKIYRSWWDALLTRPNPYTGTPLNAEPAVSSGELLNEDSFFFWTFSYDRIPARQMEVLEKMFGDWAAKRHGSIDKALAAWNNESDKRDDAAAGRLAFPHLWAMFKTRSPRSQDAARFLAEVQRGFFDDSARYLRDSLKFKGRIVASNWKTADDRVLGPLEDWTNVGADLMDLHGYFSAPHQDNSKAFGTHPGDAYRDRSLALMQAADPKVTRPACDLTFIDMVFDGKPSMVSEFTWMGINRFRTEMPLMVASQASLSGMDSMIFFALDTAGSWSTTMNTLWPLNSPTDMGQFPAAALIYRLGLVKEAGDALRIDLNKEDMFQLKGAPIAVSAMQDDNRAAEAAPGLQAAADAGQFDSKYFAVGKVRMNFVDSPTKIQAADLKTYDDPAARVLTTMTGEQRWDYGKGLYELRTPAAQGVTGFLGKGGRIDLGDVVVESPMEFGSVIAVAMDGKPLATCSKILLQVMSEESNTGWKEKARADGWKVIEDLGRNPIVVRDLAGSVSFKRADAAALSVTALDFNGYPKGMAVGAGAIALKADVLYYVIARPTRSG